MNATTCIKCATAYMRTDKQVKYGHRTCPACATAYARKYRSDPVVKAKLWAKQRARLQRPDNKERHHARCLLGKAIAAGVVVKKPCVVCGSKKSEGHHDDYSKPLNVHWLCRPHHIAHHNKHGRGFK